MRDEEEKGKQKKNQIEEEKLSAFDVVDLSEGTKSSGDKDNIITAENLIEQDDHWLCTKCGDRRKGPDLICLKCLAFKPIYFYPNIVHNP